MSDDVVLPIPNLELPQYNFALTTASLSHLRDHARAELLKGIQKDGACTLDVCPPESQ